MSAMTLTVDATAKPVGLVPMEHAVSRLAQVVMALREGQEPPYHCQALVEDESRLFHSAGNSDTEPIVIPAPQVVIWPDYVELQGRDTARVTRRVLFARDKYACQYCDFVANTRNAFKVLTVDHVKPAHLFDSRGQATTWDNVVTACVPCNRRKGGKLPMEAHMYPHNTPSEPHYVQLRFAGRLNPLQRDYVAEYYKLHKNDIVL